MQRMSKKREAIYQCLCQTKSHPSADWIFQQLRPTFPDLSLATVYRNLTQLKAAGLIQSLGIVGGQERYDGDTRPHSHLVCTRCSGVDDLPDDITLPDQVIQQAEASGWQVAHTSLRLVGLCPKCQNLVENGKLPLQ